MKSTRKTIFLALMVGCGIMLQIIESFVPVVIFVPGFKIGFANIVSLLTLMLWDIPSMWCVALLRIVLASLMMGTIFSVSFWLSLSGGFLSLIMMTIFKKAKVFSIYGISVIGACFHSVGQVIMITLIYQQYFMQLFLPILLALSIVSGLLIAIISNQVYIRVQKGMVKYGEI